MAARGTTLLAVGVGAVAVIAWTLVATLGSGDTETGLTLRDIAGSCTLTGKETEVVATKNKKLTWEVKNFCAQAQLVSVGNFRIAPQTGNTNCSAVTEGGTTSPFQQDEEARRTVSVGAASGGSPGEEKIQLQIKSRSNLGGNELTFYFSICLNQAVVDPRLVIER